MAKIKKGILGGITGSIGNIVGFQRQGNDYIRTKPAKVKNPNTEAQQKQRLRFSLMIAFLRSIKAFINIGFKQSSGNKSAFSTAMSVNVKQAIGGEFPDFAIDPEALVLSQGDLYGATEYGMDVSVQGSVTLTWTSDTSTANASENDSVMVLLFNTVNGEVAYRLNGGLRSEESLTLDIPAGWSGHDVAAFLSFRAEDENAVSGSIYVGTESAT